jgi:hypothetical protein
LHERFILYEYDDDAFTLGLKTYTLYVMPLVTAVPLTSVPAVQPVIAPIAKAMDDTVAVVVTVWVAVVNVTATVQGPVIPALQDAEVVVAAVTVPV